jgi:hypothetical protein
LTDTSTGKRHFFISFNKADRTWATWIAWVLEEAGYTVWFQDWDFRGNFIEHMHRAHSGADRTIAVLSERYFGSDFTLAEWSARLAQDPAAREDRLIPVKVGPIADEGILNPIVYADLMGCDEAEAHGRLLDRVKRAIDSSYRPKPLVRPSFPGTTVTREVPAKPRFPAGSETTDRQFQDVAWTASKPHLSSALPPIWYVPYPRNPNFTGRAEVIASLREELQSSHTAAITQVIAGLGGIGKTQLALEYAYRYASTYQAVWWIRAETRETRLSDFSSLAKKLPLLLVDETDESNMTREVVQWLDRNCGWLIIFDNVEHPRDVEPLLPKTGTGHVLITSRHGAWGAQARTIRINVWAAEEGAHYLLRRTGGKDEVAALQLAEALGYLPLALEQAAAYIDESGLSVRAYLELLGQYQAQLFKNRDLRDPRVTVATTWEISLRNVEHTSPGAVALLQLCAFMPPDRISKADLIRNAPIMPEPLKGIACDELALHDAIAALRRHSLVDATEEFISVHRLVQLVVRDRLDPLVYRTFHTAADELVHAPVSGGGEAVIVKSNHVDRLAAPEPGQVTENGMTRGVQQNKLDRSAFSHDIGRNELVRVRFPDGQILTRKYKFLQRDISERACELVEVLGQSDETPVPTKQPIPSVPDRDVNSQFIGEVARTAGLSLDEVNVLTAAGVRSFAEIDNLCRSFPSVAHLGVRLPLLSNLATMYLATMEVRVNLVANHESLPAIGAGANAPPGVSFPLGEPAIIPTKKADSNHILRHFPHMDLRLPSWPVRDQASRATSVAFAVTAAAEHYHAAARLGGKPQVLSEQFLYWAMKNRTSDPDPRSDGASLRLAREALVSVGICEGHLWPYNQAAGPTVPQVAGDYPSSAALADAAANKVSPRIYRRAPGIRAIDVIQMLQAQAVPLWLAYPYFKIHFLLQDQATGRQRIVGLMG